MFKKMRRNFIIVAMSSVSLILIIVVVVINVINYNSQVAASDQIITAIERETPPKPEPSNLTLDPKIGDNRYFIATFSSLENVQFNFDHIDKTIVTETIALKYTTEVYNSKRDRGYKDVYRFHLSNSQDTNRIVFLDCRRSIENYRTYFRITFFSSLGALVAYFLIIFFGSKFVLKPVKENLEKQNRFITNASHELKTPLTIISANNELLEMKKGENENTKSINKQIARMNSMIKELISLSKLNETKSVLFEKVNISKVLEEGMQDFKYVCDENKLKLNINITKNLEIIANNDYLKQILSIIMDNAVKYSKSYVDISLRQIKNNVYLKACNDSSDVEEGDLIKYTERFYRNEKSRTKKEGSGIGLSLLLELSNKLNAKTKVFGEHGKFNIEIIFTNKNKIK